MSVSSSRRPLWIEEKYDCAPSDPKHVNYTLHFPTLQEAASNHCGTVCAELLGYSEALTKMAKRVDGAFTLSRQNLRSFAFRDDFIKHFNALARIAGPSTVTEKKGRLLAICKERQHLQGTITGYTAAPDSNLNRILTGMLIEVFAISMRTKLLSFVLPSVTTYLRPDVTGKLHESVDSSSNLDLSRLAIDGTCYIDLKDLQELKFSAHQTLYTQLRPGMRASIYQRNATLKALERALSGARQTSIKTRLEDLLSKLQVLNLSEDPVGFDKAALHIATFAEQLAEFPENFIEKLFAEFYWVKNATCLATVVCSIELLLSDPDRFIFKILPEPYSSVSGLSFAGCDPTQVIDLSTVAAFFSMHEKMVLGTSISPETWNELLQLLEANPQMLSSLSQDDQLFWVQRLLEGSFGGSEAAKIQSLRLFARHADSSKRLSFEDLTNVLLSFIDSPQLQEALELLLPHTSPEKLCAALCQTRENCPLIMVSLRLKGPNYASLLPHIKGIGTEKARTLFFEKIHSGMLPMSLFEFTLEHNFAESVRFLLQEGITPDEIKNKLLEPYPDLIQHHFSCRTPLHYVLKSKQEIPTDLGLLPPHPQSEV